MKPEHKQYILDHAGKESIGEISRKLGLKERKIKKFLNLGSAYKATGKIEEAVATYRKAIAVDFGYEDAYCNLGIVYGINGEADEAVRSYEGAIKINPKNAKAYNNLSAIYFQKKQYRLAIQYCDKAKELGLTNTALLKALEAYR